MTRATPIPETVTIHVPFRLVKRGGRKEMLLPANAPIQRRPDDALVKALARAFRWKRMLDSGEFSTIAELAAREKIAPSYMTRVMRMTLLAPDIIEAILDGTQGPEVTLAKVLEPIPVEWQAQSEFLGLGSVEEGRAYRARAGLANLPQAAGCKISAKGPRKNAHGL